MIHNDLVNLVELFVDVSSTLRLETMTRLPRAQQIKHLKQDDRVDSNLQQSAGNIKPC